MRLNHWVRKTPVSASVASDSPNITTRQGRFEDLYRTDPVKACRAALKATQQGVSTRDRLEAINDLLGAYGVEAIRGEWENGYWCDIVAAYCNMGDTYATTVLEVRTGFGGSRFIVSTMGDFVERNSKKLGII